MDFLSSVWQFLNYLIPFIVMIGFLVAVHEWGHYQVARMLGISATQFAIGMGPVLWSREDKNGCEWQLRALPIGGFVKFLGDGDGSSTSVDESVAEVTDPVERRKIFHHRSPLDRALVILAGPVVNLILGLAIISGLYMTDGRYVAPPVIGAIISGGPAEEAGFAVGDRVLRIDGELVHDFSDIMTAVQMRPDSVLSFDVLRDEVETSLFVTTTSTQLEFLGIEQRVGSIGVRSAARELERLDAFSAIGSGAQDIVAMTKYTFVAIGQIFSGDRSFTDLGGPVKIAEMSGNAFKMGFTAYVILVAMISINLGVMNLLPIPVLDGGHLVVCAIEAITRKPANPKILGFAYTAGGVFLLTLMAAITVSDIWGLFNRP